MKKLLIVSPARLKSRLSELSDPKKRLKLTFYLGAAFVSILLVTTIALTITSRNEFCNSCHEMKSYVRAFGQSAHANITCYSCHMDDGLVRYAVHMTEAPKMPYLHLLDYVYRELGRNEDGYHKPINEGSEVSEKMDAAVCKRCHAIEKRKVTTSRNIIINHEVHEKKHIECPFCHNRTAHDGVSGYDGEKKTRLAQAQTAKEAAKEGRLVRTEEVYPNRIEMKYCMQECHTGGKGPREGPKDCTGACHPEKGFEKRPPDHFRQDWRESPAQEDRAQHTISARDDLDRCKACHEKDCLRKSCFNCHGMEMPHPYPDKIWTRGKREHADQGLKKPGSCVMCHPGATFCTDCHHGKELQKEYTEAEAKYDPSIPWLRQHPKAVDEIGAEVCFNCHNPLFCDRCHVRGVKDESLL